MLLENMVKLCDALTPVEIDIAYYVINNKEEVVNLSIQELSDKIFVSKSAIHRFCKKLGFKGFNEIKVKLGQDILELRDETEAIDVNYPFEENDDSKAIGNKLMKLYETIIYDTYNYIDKDNLNKISRLLHDSKVIDIYTHAHNLNVAENFQDKMITIGRVVNCPKNFYEQRMKVLASTNEHVAIILSYSGKAAFVLPIIQMLYRKKIPIIAIGKAGSNIHSQYISNYIYVSDKENLRDRISQFSSHIAFQYILDVIYGCIYNMDRKRNINYIHEAIEFMDDRIIETEK